MSILKLQERQKNLGFGWSGEELYIQEQRNSKLGQGSGQVGVLRFTGRFYGIKAVNFKKNCWFILSTLDKKRNDVQIAMVCIHPLLAIKGQQNQHSYVSSHICVQRKGQQVVLSPQPVSLKLQEYLQASPYTVQLLLQRCNLLFKPHPLPKDKNMA